MNYWMMKSEPNVFSIDDLRKSNQQSECWDGVRNYQARNFMRDQMRIGDKAVFYHSNGNPSGAAGTMKIVRKAYPDPTQWDQTSPYYDPKSSPDNPRWAMVDVAFLEKFRRLVPLAEIKQHPLLQDMLLTKKGNRLSIMPITKKHFDIINKMGQS